MAAARASEGRSWRWWRWPALAVAAATACFAVAIAPHGLGVTPDSTAYLTMAQALLDGEGFSQDGGFSAEGHWAPGYTLLVAAAQAATGAGVFEAAGYLHVLLFAGYSLALVRLYGRVSLSPTLVALAVLATLAAVPSAVGALALSELPFLVASVLLADALFTYRRNSGWRSLLGIGLLLGALVGLRYAGLAFLPPAVLVVVWRHRRWNRRLLRTAALVAGPALVLATWSAYLSTHGYASIRSLRWHPIAPEQLLDFGLVPLLWFVERDYLYWHLALYVLGAALCIAIVWALRTAGSWASWSRADARIAGVAAVLILGYCLFLVTSISLADAYTPVDDRTLSPLLPIAVCLGLLLLERARLSLPPPRRWLVYRLAATAAATLYLGGAAEWTGHYLHGTGYSGTDYAAASAVLAEVISDDVADDTPLYSNAADLVRFATTRRVRFVPGRINPTTREPNAEMVAECRQLSERVAAGEAAVLLLQRPGWRAPFATSGELRGQGIAEQDYGDGVVLLTAQP